MRELTVDLDAIAYNLSVIRKRVGSAKVMGVVKADGYGHGMVEVARKLEAAGIDYFGVADIDEALKLRSAAIKTPILAWLHNPEEDFLQAVEEEIELGVSSSEQLLGIANAAERLKTTAKVHLKIDTGLNRNGVTVSHWPAFLLQVKALVLEGFIEVIGIFTHLSCTSEAHDLEQIAKFETAISAARAAGIEFKLRHLTASDGTIKYPQAHYEMVRIGVSLYGLSPFTDHSSADYGLKPAMSVAAQVSLVKRVGPGEGISYGYLQRTTSETNLALVPIGYAEGFPRNASGRAVVSIKGKKYRVFSRIAMDQFVIDVGDDAIEPGDWVTIFGDPEAGVTSADELAAAADTINYEIVTRMGGRLRRTYLGSIAGSTEEQI